jgi:LysM repeat protein
MRTCTFVQLPNSPLQSVVPVRRPKPFRTGAAALAAIGMPFAIWLLARNQAAEHLEKPTAIPVALQQSATDSTEPKASLGESPVLTSPTVPLVSPGIANRPESTVTSGPLLTIYVAKRGDTLIRIAKRHGTTLKALRAVNDLKTDRITIGQQLRIPAATHAAPRGPAPI